MNKLIIALAALTAITLTAPVAHAGFDCDEDDIAACVRSFIPKKAFTGAMPSMPKMPSMPSKAPRATEKPEAPKAAPRADRSNPQADKPAEKVAEKPAKVAGSKDNCKKYLSSIGQMVDVRCD